MVSCSINAIKPKRARKGMVKSDKRLFIIVKETASAILPISMNITRLAVAPPGQIAIKTRPTLNEGSIFDIKDIKNPNIGRSTI